MVQKPYIKEDHFSGGQTTLRLRDEGVPIDIARLPADCALSLSRELWLFLNQAINSAYNETDRVKSMLAVCSLVKMWVSEVRGY